MRGIYFENFVKKFEKCYIFSTKLLTKYFLKDIMYLFEDGKVWKLTIV